MLTAEVVARRPMECNWVSKALPAMNLTQAIRGSVSWLAVIGGALWCATGAAAEASRQANTERQEKVQQLLRFKCAKCHGPLEPKGGLNLSTLRGVARGGESGAVVEPASTEMSFLWQRVAADEMPPDAPLSAEDKSLLREWIEAGASGLPPGDLGPIVGADHWAFQPLRKNELPSVRDGSRIRTEVDRYVQARLEARGLSLGPDADAQTLIRRVSLDLTGLLPTPVEIDEFVADSAPNAYERMVERYLASPHFGERWGKHWLDAAGYADSNGYFSADTDRPLAYRYRDYVIRSLNADKPFDRFLHEQVAGDEISGFRPGEPTTPETIELLVATHFLRNGQDGTDIGVQEPEAFEIDRRAALEAAVQVSASSLLGLTLQCARCHDHKFEPITQQEYYQFQAIMFPAFNPQDWVNPQDRIVYASLPGDKEAWEENERRLTAELARLRGEYTEWLAANREPSETVLHDKFDDDSWNTRWKNTAPGDDHPGGELTVGGASANAAQVADGALQIIAGSNEAWLSTASAFDWTPGTQGSWIQVTFDLVDDKVGGAPAMRIGYTIAAHDFDDSSGRDGGNLLIDGNPAAATSIYSDYPGDDQKILGQIGQQGYEPGRNYGVRVTNVGEDQFRIDHLIDGLPDDQSLKLSASDLPDGGFAFFYCCGRSYVVDEVRIERSLPESAGQTDVAEQRKKLDARRKTYEENRSELVAQQTPEPGRAIAWVTDKSAKPVEVPFLTRGAYHLRGPSVEPDALQILTDLGREYRPESHSDAALTTGRRLGLAKWLTRADGRPAALVARLHANRIWHQYFGRGIVATTDNLGLGGALPTHLELLDDLAAGFIASGWSQKALHRRVVTSTVYRQSSSPHLAGLAVDPDNRWLWRRPIRRLQAEVIRDSLLVSAGQLDVTPFGPYVPTRQTLVGEVVVDADKPGARRRSIYLQQRRSQTLSLLKVFDAPAVATICTARPSSTVPLQSLTLLNSEFSMTCSEAFARRLLAETGGTPSAFVQRAWRVATSRQPTATEQSLALEFLAEQRKQYDDGEEASVWALADFCQMLLASNAFLYLE
jgi:hypothetical protein